MIALGTACRLERLENGQALRTSAVEGETLYAPRVGHRFAMTGKPLDPAADFRLVRTSLVTSVRTEDSIVYDFDTLNSTYRLTLLSEEPTT